MVCLLPTIERLLEVLLALVQEHLDGARIGDVPVGFEFLADAMTDVGGRTGDGVQGHDFGCLRRWVSKLGYGPHGALTARTQPL